MRANSWPPTLPLIYRCTRLSSRTKLGSAARCSSPRTTLRCRGFRSGKSLPGPQTSTNLNRVAPTRSIEISYFLGISTDFRKRQNLVREQEIGGSDPLAPTICFQRHRSFTQRALGFSPGALGEKHNRSGPISPTVGASWSAKSSTVMQKKKRASDKRSHPSRRLSRIIVSWMPRDLSRDQLENPVDVC